VPCYRLSMFDCRSYFVELFTRSSPQSNTRVLTVLGNYFKWNYLQVIKHTQRGRSRAQHVRDREADIETAKNWSVVHLRRSKREVRRASPYLGWFRTVGERGEWRGPKGQSDALAVVVLWRKVDWAARTVGPSWRAHFWWRLIKTPNSSARRLAIRCFQGNQYVTLSSPVLFRARAFQ